MEPGFARCEIRPQPGDLKSLRLAYRTVRGTIRFAAEGDPAKRRYAIAVPEGVEAVALFPPELEVPLPPLGRHPLGPAQYALASGKETAFEVKAGT